MQAHQEDEVAIAPKTLFGTRCVALELLELLLLLAKRI
jgi:hypothetical protein